MKHYYESLGHLLVVADGVKHSDALNTGLKAAGCSDEFVTQAAKLAHAGEELIAEKIEVCSEDRICEHATHVAATEVEMWHQATVRKAKNGGLEGALAALLAAKQLHGHDHTATIVAQAQRALAVIATTEEIQQALGDRRTVRDVLNKGFTMLKRLYSTTDIRLAPQRGEERFKVFGKIEEHHHEMNAWLIKAEDAAADLAGKDQQLLGWLGIVPEGVGVPIGGSAFGVVLHERGQTAAPDPTKVKACSGWSIGRQGNRENLGTGFAD